jgi:hypothetical protein
MTIALLNAFTGQFHMAQVWEVAPESLADAMEQVMPSLCSFGPP